MIKRWSNFKNRGEKVDSDENITQQLRPLFEDLKTPISTSKAIAKNINLIMQLKVFGLTNAYIAGAISENTDREVNENTLKTIIYRTNKKKVNRAVNIDNISNLNIKDAIVSTSDSPLKEISLSDWNSIGVENNRLIDDLIEFGLTPTDVKEWGCANDIIRRKKLTELIAKQNKGR